MRSLLFAPGDDQRKIEKAYSGDADVIILDLEDSVALNAKPAAREITSSALADNANPADRPRVFVRVNALRSGFCDEDLEAVVKAKPDGIMLPKAEGAEDINNLALMLGRLEDNANIAAPIPIIAISTETARGVFANHTYADADRRLEALTWGGEDLSAELGATANRDENGHFTDPYRLARSLCLIGARAAELTPIDTVYVNYKDADGLRLDCAHAVRDGFTGKLAIHPAQVPIINEAFTPSEADIEKAQKIVQAFQDAGDAGVIGIDGEMFDEPHLARAKNLLERAGGYRATH